MNTKLFGIFVALSLVFAPMLVLAQSEQSMNALCQAKDFDFGIAQWHYQNGKDAQWELVNSIEGWTTSVTGDTGLAEYEASPAADGVLTNGAATIFDGASGTIEKGVNHNGNIQTVVFCGNTPADVPEFGSLLAVGTLGLMGAALVISKRA
jgi:hypothetical protein